MWFFSYCFRVSLSVTSINWLWHVYMWISLHLSYLKFIELLGYLDWYCWIFKIKLGTLSDFFKYSFCPFFFLSPSGTTIMHVLIHLMVSHVSQRLCSFWFIVFFFLFSLQTGKSQLKSADSFFFHLRSAIEPILWIFPSQLLYFSSLEFLYDSCVYVYVC